MNNIKSIVCTTANKMVKDGYTRSEAFKQAWAMIKNSESYNPVHSSNKEAEVVEISSQVREYRELQTLINQLEEKANSIKKSIIDVMETQQAEELQIDVFKVRYITVKSNRFDTKDFKQAHTDLYTQYLKESTCKRFTVA